MNQPRLHHRRPGRLRNEPVALVCLILAIACARCASSAPRSPSKSTAAGKTLSLDAVTDPCATRLHDLLGGLLLFYATHNDLPPNLKSLPLPSGDTAASLTCPVSHQPYIYDPRGLPAPDGKSMMVIYEAVPAHRGVQGGFRWAVAVAEPRPGQPLTGEVIAAPESAFTVPASR